MNQTFHSFLPIVAHTGLVMSLIGTLETNFNGPCRHFSPSDSVATPLTLHLSAEKSARRVARPLFAADPLLLITHLHRSCSFPPGQPPTDWPLPLSVVARHTWVHPGAIKHLRGSEPMIYFDVEKILGKIFIFSPFHPSVQAVNFPLTQVSPAWWKWPPQLKDQHKNRLWDSWLHCYRAATMELKMRH